MRRNSEARAYAWQVRQEQYKLRPNLSATITGSLLSEMTYTRQVVKEVLRYRPPAPMVPQVTFLLQKACTILLKTLMRITAAMGRCMADLHPYKEM